MYMFFWFFKQLFYALKRVFKHTFLLLFIFFIAFLILFCNKSQAFYVGTTNWVDPPSQVINVLQSVPEYSNPNYYWFVFGYNGYHICTFPKPSGFQAYAKPARYFYTNSSFTYKQYEINFNYQITATNTASVTPSAEWGFGLNGDSTVYFLSNFPVYDYNNHNNKLYDGYDVNISPYITNTNASITSWSFDTLTINCGTIPVNSYCELQFYYNNTLYYLDLSSFKSIENGTLIYNIPKSNISYPLVIRNGSVFEFELFTRQPVERWFTSIII